VFNWKTKETNGHGLSVFTDTPYPFNPLCILVQTKPRFGKRQHLNHLEQQQGSTAMVLIFITNVGRARAHSSSTPLHCITKGHTLMYYPAHERRRGYMRSYLPIIQTLTPGALGLDIGRHGTRFSGAREKNLEVFFLGKTWCHIFFF
jgi:hypothetical protein